MRVIRPPSEEIYGRSTQGQNWNCWKVHSVAYNNAVADNTGRSHSFSRCCPQICEIPRNSPKIRTYSSSRSSKVINFGVNWRIIYNFPLVINSNCVRISYSFWDIDAFSSKWLVSLPHHCLTPPSGGTTCDINVLNTPLKSTQWGYNSVADNTGFLHSFSGCCLPNSRNHAKFRQNLTLLQLIQGHRSWCN